MIAIVDCNNFYVSCERLFNPQLGNKPVVGSEEIDIYRINEWKNYLNYLVDHGLNKFYFFMHIHDDKAKIDFSKYVQSKLS
ncbi:hypothetical protein BH11BAC3_BH11BAC3_19670 [soil metagenome]